MPRPKNSVPSYTRHKPTDQAYVRVPDGNGGRRVVYLGRYNSPESRAEYARILARIGSSPHSVQKIARGGACCSDVTLNELLLAYTHWFEANHRGDDGKPFRGGTGPRFTLRTVRERFGLLPAAEFGPKALKALRDGWVGAGLSRNARRRAGLRSPASRPRRRRARPRSSRAPCAKSTCCTACRGAGSRSSCAPGPRCRRSPGRSRSPKCRPARRAAASRCATTPPRGRCSRSSRPASGAGS